MSTQQLVTGSETTAQPAPGLGAVLWGWFAACAVAAVASYAFGADLTTLAGATALALSPGLAGFILLPNLNESKAALGLVGAWLVAGVGLVAGAGGALSPLAVVLAAPVALGIALRLRWVAEIAAVSVVCYPIAAWLHVVLGPTEGLGPFAELMAAAAIVLAGAAAAVAISRNRAEAAQREGREAALNRRVAELAHELRTPLNHIMGFADAIESQVFGEIGERNKEYAGFIRQSGARLLLMINDLLDLSRIDAGRMGLTLEVFDARALIESVGAEFKLAAEDKSIKLELDLPAEPVLVRADERAWRRILTNTLGNAFKFTPEGGRVGVAARADGERFILDTFDNGPGIPETERARLGRPYQRGVGGLGVEGAGLGLSLVRALARAHGGALSIGDAPGGGALVRVAAPILVRQGEPDEDPELGKEF